jgi:hypothetical protein
MAKSYPELLNDKKSRARLLARAAELAGKEGLLDLIQEHGQRQEVRNSAKAVRKPSRFRWPRSS